jgi:antitoxin (DNA-binding transcriptional repressor) of toxin-antitoxin stability system
MPTATVRDLRNDFARVSLWIANGEAVTVTKDGKPFATLAPIRGQKPAPQWPDLAARRRRLFPKGVKGQPASEIISDGRGER